MQKKLLLLSFIEGAAVMAAELCGAKLLAPIFGSSLYVWASVLGITLIALALGYFYGGIVADRSKDRAKSLFLILIAAALLLLLMPVISYYLVPRISYLTFIPAVIISTLLLLFFPVFLLGASSPLFIVLQADKSNSAGKVSGNVYAVSTVGGILATFLCGFYLIPVIGLNITLLIYGSILFISTVLIFKFFTPKSTGGQLLLFAAFVYLNLQFSLKKTDHLIVSDGLLGRFEVQDVVSSGRGVRLLKINNIIQTEMDLSSKTSVSGYVTLFDTLISKSSTPKKALVLGLGGGLTANLLVEKNYKVTGVEFDERIIEAAKKYFYLDKTVESVCEDARYYLNHCSEKFDLILVDAFKAEEQPSHILSTESLEQLKKNLNDSAIVLINWHGYTNARLGKGTAVLYNTLQKSGFRVTMTSLSDDQDHRNIIFVAEQKSDQNEEVTSSTFISSYSAARNLPFQIKDLLPEVNVVNTDDKPVLEKYNALANKTWRTNYLRYYQNKK